MSAVMPKRHSNAHPIFATILDAICRPEPIAIGDEVEIADSSWHGVYLVCEDAGDGRFWCEKRFSWGDSSGWFPAAALRKVS